MILIDPDRKAHLNTLQTPYVIESCSLHIGHKYSVLNSTNTILSYNILIFHTPLWLNLHTQGNVTTNNRMHLVLHFNDLLTASCNRRQQDTPMYNFMLIKLCNQIQQHVSIY